MQSKIKSSTFQTPLNRGTNFYGTLEIELYDISSPTDYDINALYLIDEKKNAKKEIPFYFLQWLGYNEMPIEIYEVCEAHCAKLFDKEEDTTTDIEQDTPNVMVTIFDGGFKKTA